MTDYPPAQSQSKEERKAIRREVWSKFIYDEIFKTETRTMVLGSISLIISSLSNALLPRYLANLYFGKDEKGDSGGKKGSKVVSNDFDLKKLFLLVITGGMASFLRTTFLTKAEARVIARVRRRLFEQLLHAPMEYLDSLSGGGPSSCNNMLVEETANMGKICMTISSLVRSTVSCVYNAYSVVTLSPRLCGYSLIVAPVSAAGIGILLKFKEKARARQRGMIASAAAFAEERLSNISAVKMNGREFDDSNAYGSMQDNAAELDTQVAIADGLFFGGIFWMTSASLAAIIWKGRTEVAEGRLSSKGLTRFIGSTFLLGLGISGVGQSRSKLESQLVSAERLYKIFSSSSKLDTGSANTKEKDQEILVKWGQETALKVEDISFSYGNGTNETFVLKDVSFELPPGKIVALVGKNGSGKSTLVSLLAGLYEPKQGNISITMDGKCINSCDMNNAYMSVVQQEATASLFGMSVMENIRYSKPDATEEEVRAAARAANCELFIEGLDGGYSYNIGRGGCRISGGQRQRICLARALLTDPKILVLDEPASQLDSEGGDAFEDAVVACRESNKSLLWITHKPASLKLVDSILVLEDGRIVESGDFSTLRKKKDSALSRLMPAL